MSIATCPPPPELERLFLGGLTTQEADALEEHVLECASCLNKLKSLLRSRETLVADRDRETLRDSLGPSPAIDALLIRLECLRPTPTSPVLQGAAMLTLSCSACQKKLSVKDDAAGKKVKCPACGQLLVVPKAVPAGIVDGTEVPTIPPASDLDVSDPASSQVETCDQPTNPPVNKPDATISVQSDSGPESSLTDFLAPPQADDELGRLGEFRILKILGHGGMGVVFLGEDNKLHRKVAIKAMLPHLAQSKSSQQRFLREAKSAAALEHDHIVAIHHVSEDRGAPYIVMPLLKGEPLDERLKREEPVPLDDVLRIGREVSEGLAAAHATGLIHRDIKPANIWLEAPRSRVKILDFGLARAAAQESGLTQQGAIIGTPAYMAPEQGRGGAVDARCDLFSLGVVLYRMCTG